MCIVCHAVLMRSSDLLVIYDCILLIESKYSGDSWEMEIMEMSHEVSDSFVEPRA